MGYSYNIVENGVISCIKMMKNANSYLHLEEIVNSELMYGDDIFYFVDR